jgi:hypothetical protein
MSARNKILRLLLWPFIVVSYEKRINPKGLSAIGAVSGSIFLKIYYNHEGDGELV